jgi:hypothetical protein
MSDPSDLADLSDPSAPSDPAEDPAKDRVFTGVYARRQGKTINTGKTGMLKNCKDTGTDLNMPPRKMPSSCLVLARYIISCQADLLIRRQTDIGLLKQNNGRGRTLALSKNWLWKDG